MGKTPRLPPEQPTGGRDDPDARIDERVPDKSGPDGQRDPRDQRGVDESGAPGSDPRP